MGLGTNCGGFIATTYFNNQLNAYALFNNCYVYFFSSSGGNGGFIGNLDTNDANFNKCYSENTTYLTLPGSLVGINTSGTINVWDTYELASDTFTQVGSYNVYTNYPTLTVTSESTFQTLSTVISNNTLSTYWSSSDWINNSGQEPILKTFQNLSIWDGTYLIFTDTPNYSSTLCVLPVVCFAENTPIQTSHGLKSIQTISKGDIINGYEVDFIVKSLIGNKPLIKIEKDAISENIPSSDTYVTKQHLFNINGKEMTAFEMSKIYNNIYQVNNVCEYVYNIVLKNRQHAFITVNGLKAETLGIKALDNIKSIMMKKSIKI
jgi:hypothetical protein